eukprot:267289-Hanusia_phi.AAC.1
MVEMEELKPSIVDIVNQYISSLSKPSVNACHPSTGRQIDEMIFKQVEDDACSNNGSQGITHCVQLFVMLLTETHS